MYFRDRECVHTLLTLYVYATAADELNSTELAVQFSSVQFTFVARPLDCACKTQKPCRYVSRMPVAFRFACRPNYQRNFFKNVLRSETFRQRLKTRLCTESSLDSFPGHYVSYLCSTN